MCARKATWLAFGLIALGIVAQATEISEATPVNPAFQFATWSLPDHTLGPRGGEATKCTVRYD